MFIINCQVAEPLRAMVMGAPLEDARHLAQRYDRMRQEAEAQVCHFPPLLWSVVFHRLPLITCTFWYILSSRL